MEAYKQIPQQEKTPEGEKFPNPNSIGEILSIGNDLATSPDRVYRSVRGQEAINDLNDVGYVRNAHSAGVLEHSRWGDRVFWSRGGEGKFHIVGDGMRVIEAPFAVASERTVRKEDVTAVYVKNEDGSVQNVWEDLG